MIAKVTKVESKPSRYGGIFYYMFFNNMEGKSYRTCLYPEYRNFERWKPVISKFNSGVEVWLKGLFLGAKGLINADSPFTFHQPERGVL